MLFLAFSLIIQPTQDCQTNLLKCTFAHSIPQAQNCYSAPCWNKNPPTPEPGTRSPFLFVIFWFSVLQVHYFHLIRLVITPQAALLPSWPFSVNALVSFAITILAIIHSQIQDCLYKALTTKFQQCLSSPTRSSHICPPLTWHLSGMSRYGHSSFDSLTCSFSVSESL